MSARHDVVIVGGGIQGVGVAQAAAAAGYSTLLLERTALAYGTSRRSSKLIHGGLRYLESAQFRLVREALAERALLARLAPDLVRLVPFHIPIYRHTRRQRLTIAAGLTLYSALGGFAAVTRFALLPRGHWGGLDGLATRDLRAVFRYLDGQTDDAALTRAVMRSAQSLGAELECPAEFTAALRHAGGYRVRYRAHGRELETEATALVNAAGPWVAEVAARVRPQPPTPAIELVQGTHLLFAGTTAQGIYYVEAPDGRAVFVMPWQGHTLVGTTETPHPGAPDAAAPTAQEVAYLRQVYAAHFTGRPQELVSSFAGLRVLPRQSASAFHRSRETLLALDDPRAPHYLAVCGGKLTTYRLTAARILARLAPVLPAVRPRADTAALPLHAD